MTPAFRPVGESAGRLVVGSRFKVKIEGVPRPATCRVTVADDARELTWCGGIKGLMWAEHRFLFEPKSDTSVEVVSAETWHGVVARLMRNRVERNAAKIGKAQLAALASSLAG